MTKSHRPARRPNRARPAWQHLEWECGSARGRQAVEIGMLSQAVTRLNRERADVGPCCGGAAFEECLCAATSRGDTQRLSPGQRLACRNAQALVGATLTVHTEHPGPHRATGPTSPDAWILPFV